MPNSFTATSLKATLAACSLLPSCICAHAAFLPSVQSAAESLLFSRLSQVCTLAGACCLLLHVPAVWLQSSRFEVSNEATSPVDAVLSSTDKATFKVCSLLCPACNQELLHCMHKHTGLGSMQCGGQMSAEISISMGSLKLRPD